MVAILLTLLVFVFLNFHASLLLITSSYQVSLVPNQTYPLSCSNRTQTCSSLLYHQFNGLTRQQLSSYYSVDPSHITTPYGNDHQQDCLVSVSCSCNEINGSLGRTVVGFIYGTVYGVQPNDTFGDVSNKIYSGQALEVGGENVTFSQGNNVSVPLLCGCVDSSSQIMVTYTAQPHDTLSDIGHRLSARVDGILKLNKILNNSDFVDVGWVLFVPMEKKGIPPPKSGKTRKWERWSIVAGVISTVTLVTLCAFGALILFRRKRNSNYSHESMATTHQSKKHTTLKTEDFSIFETERPVTYKVEEMAEATKNFDESRIIGVGGYGTVYLGMIGQKEVAVKKMKSSLCKQFYAELKVLCKIHHINVVELLGYASGDEHLYLVYEYVQNGSLSDHLHNPLTKGFDEALSWTARTQIALDSAKGIEYIHDHTKARYVHRDIKTSNILLDQGMRAKVGDFGLAKLVERGEHDDLTVSRLVGTPGYLPPESIKELQVTTKTDVFAFGVVLAELVTGSRALVRDIEEPQKMKSLISVVDKMFEDEDPFKALVGIIDDNLQGNYPMENVYKMVEMAAWCLSREAVDRPDMREVVVVLSQIVKSSLEWELLTSINDGRRRSEEERALEMEDDEERALEMEDDDDDDDDDDDEEFGGRRR